MYLTGGETQSYLEGLKPSNNALKNYNLYFSPFTYPKLKSSNFIRKTTGGV